MIETKNISYIKDVDVDTDIQNFVRNITNINIDRYIETGGNGELYFGKRDIIGDRVALKFYYYGQNQNAHEEPILLRAINHDNVLKIFDAKIINSDFAYFLTPEIIEGNLDDYRNKNIISIHKALDIIEQILNGLTELHKEPNRLVHRDLKTLNILIDETNRPIIADLGSVKRIPNGYDNINASKNTLIYKSPEIIESNSYSFQSDLYQVGIVLYQLLGGKLSYNSKDWLNKKQIEKLLKITGDFEQWKFVENIIEGKILKSKVVDFETLHFYIQNSPLKKIIKNATHKDLSKRYKTTSEFLKAIYDFRTNSINWWFENGIYFAENNNSLFKIIISNNNIELFKKNNSGNWRKNNSHNNEIDKLIKIIKK